MKNLIFILLAFTSVIIAQPDNQSSSVELPEFIIVGYRSVDIPNMKKPEPTYTSTLSKEFFSPTYTPEDFKVASPSAPKQHKINLYGESPISQCGIELGAGIYTLPRGKFFCNQSFDDLILKGQVWGLNQREHIEYSGKNNIGGRIGLDYYADNQDAFLSGSKLSFYTQYDWNSYYLFGSPTPSERRITNRGLIGLELNNKANETVKYGFSVSGNLLKLNENNFSEFGLRGSAFLKFKFGDLGWIVIGNIINQSLKNNLSGENNYLYFNASGDVNLLLFEAIETRVGVYYANQGSYHFISPTASLIMKIGRRLSLIGEYAPFTEFLMFTDFITQNNYINLGVQDNAFIKNKINLKAAIKYQYDTYFEIIGGAQLLRASNFPFFQDTT
ncbi:MAG: hypothetical protein JW866_11175, partial [Ignavibacteriales bacterium]|nr:hypothetical protein [Ignavibacteriales bacterium]